MANNRKINGGGLRTASDPNVSAPLFNFYAYETGKTYYNNSEQVDFVTYDGNLYVCTDFGGKYASEPTPERNGGFLMIVKKGEDGQQGLTGRPGIDGSTPEIKVRFEGKQLVIYDAATQTRLASSPELVGPTWKPVQKDNKITWKLEEGTPTSIDLDELRPKEEHPVLFRLNSDNTKRSDEETGPGYYIQWKREGNEEWTDLMSISELMNIALAGVSFWWADDENGATDANGNPVQRLHFGHKQVVRATYDASKLGNKRIAEVELGDVLFDAGEVPFANYDDDIAALNAFLCDLQGELDVLRNLIPDDYVKMVNGKRPNNNGEVVLDDYYDKDTSDARYLREHQPIKTLAGQSLVGRGDIGLKTVNGNTLLTVNPNGEDVKVGTVRSIKVNDNAAVTPDSNGMVQLNISGTGEADTSDCVKSVTINGERKTPVNGNVSFTISVGETSLFDVKVENEHLKKTYDGVNWIDLGPINGGSTDPTDLTQLKLRVGDPNDSSKRNHLFVSYDNGVTWTDAGEFLDTDTTYELQGYATIQMLEDLYYQKSVLYTKTEIDNMLSGADVDLTSYRTFTIYQRSASNRESDIHLPNDNIVAVWNVSEGVLDLPANYTDWTNHPENATPQKPYLWMASATFESKQGSRVSPWDGPFCLTGEDGKEGADGKGIEFIYHLGPMGVDGTKPTAPSIDYTKSKKGSSTDTRTKAWWATSASTDYCPGDNNNGYWTDNPQGIDDSQNSRVEWASIRKSHYDSTNEVTVWEDFCEPFIWAMWGEDGMDGDGVQYIFLATANPITVAQYPPIHLRDIYNDANGADVSAEENDNNIDYNHPKASYEYYDTREFIPNGWTDDPSDVDAQQPYEYVSLRRYNGSTGHWGPYSVPKVWRMYKVEYHTSSDVINNYQPYTEFAFTRTDADLTGYTVTGGQSYANPLQGVVTKNAQNQVVNNITWTDGVPSNSTEQIWVITALIGDETQQQTATWTGPWKLGDRPGIQIEYSKDAKAEAVYLNPALWSNLTLNEFQGTDEQREASWEAAVLSNYGVWSDNVADPIYMATTIRVDGVWRDWVIAKIKGEQGGTGDTGPQGENGSPGADGKSIEYVYYRTDSEDHIPNTHPTLGTYDSEDVVNRTEVSEDIDRDDFFPKVVASGFTVNDGTYWHDHPQGVTSSLPCEWVAVRHSTPTVVVDNGSYTKHKNWGEFNVALWSKYGKNGRDGDGIEYVFWDLTEEQASSVSGDVLPTRLSDTNYTDNHNPARHIYESECLPSITLTVNGSNVSLIAKDDNPGVTDQKPYVYASMRKWKYDSAAGEHKWGEFSPIKLWLIKPEDVSSNGILDILNSTFPVQVDSNNVLVNNKAYASSNVELRNSRVLMNIDSIVIEGTNSGSLNVSYNYETETASYDNTQTVTIINNGVSASVRVYSAGCHEDRRCSISLDVTFDKVNGQNPELLTPFIIPITAINNTLGIVFEGTDFFRLNPTKEEKLTVTDSLGITKMWTTSKGSGDYNVNGLHSISASGNGSSLLKNTQVKYFFKFDNQGNYTTFTTPVAVLNSNGRYQVTHNGTTIIDGNGDQTLNFYFDKNGNSVNSQENAFFRIYLSNVDFGDNPDPWTVWVSWADIYFDKFYSSHVEGQDDYPIDEITIGVGWTDSVSPIDYEIIPILYNGKNGTQGAQGIHGNSTEIIAYVETTSDEVVVNPTTEEEDDPGEDENASNGGAKKAPTRGGGEQTDTPEIEIDENGEVHVINNGDGTITISDDSGDYSVLDIQNGSVNKFQILKITEYDNNNVAHVRYETQKILTTEKIPSWYLIKDAFYYSAGEDPLAHPQNEKIYALIVDNGQLVVLEVANNNPGDDNE